MYGRVREIRSCLVEGRKIIMDITRKCPHCQKVYFLIEEDKCPHCGKEDEFNPFKDIFGDDNPFSNMGVT